MIQIRLEYLKSNLNNNIKPSDTIETISEITNESKDKVKSSELDVDYKSHVILILDETIQSLPWECIPSLSSRNCSRSPSLSLLLNTFVQIQHHRHQQQSSVLENEIDEKKRLKSKPKGTKGTSERKIEHNNTTTITPSNISQEKKVILSKCWYTVIGIL